MYFHLQSGLWVALSFFCCSVVAQVSAPTVPTTPTAAAESRIADGPRFDILEFQVEGNTVLSVEAIERAVTPFLGLNKQMEGPDSVEAARAALEKAYQSSGYLTVFVDVPEQRVDDGVVVLQVSEGRIGRLSVTGSRYFSQGYIRAKVPELAEGKVPNFNTVQQELAEVNRSEDRRVQPVMRAGIVPGTVETELKVEDHLPFSASIAVDNRNAANTDPLRTTLTGRYDNLWQLDHSLAFMASTAPQAPRQSKVFSLNYTVPAAGQSAWVAYVLRSDSSVAALGDVNVLGKGTIAGLRYAKPLINTVDQSHSITLGIDYKDVQQVTGTASSTVSTPLKYLPLNLAYNGTVDEAPLTRTSLSLQVVANSRSVFKRVLADCPGGPQDQFECNRQGGDGSFATLRGDFRQSFGLFSAGSLHARLGGQLATGPVPSGEQYTIGGAESVRGYFEAEGAGDNALLGSIEWHSPDQGARASGWLGVAPERGFSQTYGLLFVDVARAYTDDPATGQAPHMSLAGTGLGMRARWRRATALEFDVAWPLKTTVSTPAHSPRVHVRLSTDL